MLDFHVTPNPFSLPHQPVPDLSSVHASPIVHSPTTAMSNPIRNVTLVGATGNIGSVLLTTLLAAPHLRVTILRRASSTAPLPAGVPTATVSDAWRVPELTAALRGADAVVAAFPLTGPEGAAPHIRLAEAAAATGTVRRYVPADFGGVDARSARARALVPGVYGRREEVRRRLVELGEREPGFVWTAVVNGYFFDWGLRNGALHFHLETRRAEILGDGKHRSSVATLGRIAEAVVRLLGAGPDVGRNTMAMVQSFCVSQSEVLASLERVTGETWAVEYMETEAFIEKHKKLVAEGNAHAVDELVFALGMTEANWEQHEDFAMGVLGLENEDLDTVVKKVLEA